jgi:2-phosphosulfolactate phosphatase
MNRQLNIHFLPNLASPDAFAGSTAVVIDVLRATTVISHALASGAKKVVPCLEIEEAREIAARLPAGEAVLGGERRGVLIEGFDLGNSPAEYSPERVAGRTVVFTTTNGTRAMHACREADRIMIASFVNLSAVGLSLATSERVEIVCAGTDGEISREDVLAAGAIAQQLGSGWTLNDSANLAQAAWSSASRELSEELRDSAGGRNLVALALAADIDTAASMDRFSQVPQLEPESWQIALPDLGSGC